VKKKTLKKQYFTVQLVLSAVMSSLVCVATFLIRIPNPPTQGYINFGDAMIFVSALSFNAVVGGFAGGVGAALADILAGYAHFAPFTLIIKGVEGIIAGLIAGKKSVLRDSFAVAIAGSEMIVGYFLVEFYLYGLGAALTEIPGNIVQMVIGGIIGIPIAIVIRKRLPETLKH